LLIVYLRVAKKIGFNRFWQAKNKLLRKMIKNAVQKSTKRKTNGRANT